MRRLYTQVSVFIALFLLTIFLLLYGITPAVTAAQQSPRTTAMAQHTPSPTALLVPTSTPAIDAVVTDQTSDAGGEPTRTVAPPLVAPEHLLPRIFPQLSITATLHQFSAPTPTPGGVSIDALRPRTTAVAPVESWRTTENILILGTDRRPGWTDWHTDTIMIVGIDRPNQRVALLSIPRDLYVVTPGYGWGRINRVDYVGEEVLKVAGGGPALVSTVLSNTLGVATTRWVRIEMGGFEKIVDAVGGVTVTLDCPIYEPVYHLTLRRWTYFTLPAGDVTLNGEDAYWFVRLRRNESDFGRSRRQRQLLWGLRNKAVDSNLLLQLPQLWTALTETFTTDLSALEIVDFVSFGLPLDPSRVTASALRYPELAEATSAYGGWILRMADPASVRAKVAGAWQAVPLVATSAREASGNCKPPPPGAPVYETTNP